MELAIVLGFLLLVATVALVFQVVSSRGTRSRLLAVNQSTGARLSALEAESKKNQEALEFKRKETAELKDRLKDVKKRRHDEQEAARVKKDVQEIREQIEKEMERKLALAREEAETAKAALKKLSSEVDALKARRPAPAAAAPETKAPPAPPPARELSNEERARLDTAERHLTKAKQRIEELEAEAKKARGRTETDRRVFLVQKGELDLAKDRFRTLEARFNELVLERDELHKQRWLLDKELKSLRPTAEAPEATSASRPAPERAGTSPEAPPSGAPVDGSDKGKAADQPVALPLSSKIAKA
jgi:nitrogen fixation protein FixH